MIRLFVTCLLLATVAPFCGGLSAQAEDVPPLRVATFRADVTPPLGHLLYILPLKTIEHPLLAKGIVLEDGSGRYVLCALDWCIVSNSSRDMFRSKMAEAAGTEMARVTLQTVHQHTAPVIDGDAWEVARRLKDPPKYFDPQFLADVTDRVAAAVAESIGRLERFDRIGTGQAKVVRVASSRRLPLGDGTVRGRMSAGAKNPELAALPEGKIDPYLKTITFARGTKPLVRLHYYATHPQTYYREGRASYDFPGMARERLQEAESVFQVYFTGCAADIAVGKYNNGTEEARAGLAQRLYEGMRASIASTRFVPAVGLTWRTVPLLLEPRGDPGNARADFDATLADTSKPPVQRIYGARRIAFLERSQRPIELSCLTIGPVYVLHLPGECMLEFQLHAQSQRPDDFVAVAAHGDGCPGYICTEAAFAEGGYEPSASSVAPESEAVLKAAIRKLLGGETLTPE